MGLKVSPSEAARLTGRTERTIRLWITSGRLRAEPSGFRQQRKGVGPYRWIIDTDDLAAVPAVSMNGAALAEMETRRAVAEAGGDVIARLSRLETEVTRLRGEVAELRAAMTTTQARTDRSRRRRSDQGSHTEPEPE